MDHRSQIPGLFLSGGHKWVSLSTRKNDRFIVSLPHGALLKGIPFLKSQIFRDAVIKVNFVTEKDQLFQFERQNWTDFRHIDRLCPRVGIPSNRLRRLVVKELVDNALDAAGSCRLGSLDGGGFYVEDDGPGLDPEDLPRLFSVNRPYVSTKFLKKPSRGSFGNGLRVVAGAALASEGRIVVITQNQLFKISYDFVSGRAVVENGASFDWPAGTRIEVSLGHSIPHDGSFLSWGEQACLFANGKPDYKGQTSPWWFTSDAFAELIHCAGSTPVRLVVSWFAGCSGAKAGKVAGRFLKRESNSLTFDEAEALLTALRENSLPIKAEKLGTVGRIEAFAGNPIRVVSEFVENPERGDIAAQVPFIIEVWAKPVQEPNTDSITLCVNRSPVVGGLNTNRGWHNKGNRLYLTGCGLDSDTFEAKKRKHPIEILVNIQVPSIPKIDASKTPDLSFIWPQLKQSLETAARKVVHPREKRRGEDSSAPRPPKLPSQKDIILENLGEAIDKASGGRRHRYSVRQLFYVIRPYVMQELRQDLTYDNFEKVLTDHESERGHDLPGIYRDERGAIYIPHQKQTIPLGTLNVEGFERPKWTFNKILFIEKQGLFQVLLDIDWPERNDCALLTSKGFASRAARDLLDLFAHIDEPIQVFALHDADAQGTVIYQSLVEETKARGARKVEVINIGLEPWEAVDMGFDVESVQKSAGRSRQRRKPVADYVNEYSLQYEGDPYYWEEWLQSYRVELNAMTSPQFIEYVDRKFEEYEALGKVIPPRSVLADHFGYQVEDQLREAIENRIIEEARIEERVDSAYWAALKQIRPDIEAKTHELGKIISEALTQAPAGQWKQPVELTAHGIVSRWMDDKRFTSPDTGPDE